DKLPLADKLKQIYDDALSVIREYKPEEVVVENAFYAKNIRTTLVLGHVRGVLLLAGKMSDAHLVELTPREIKKFVTGNGASGKESVQYMVGRHLNIKTETFPPDATDALAAALAHALSITRG
ncbi:MAG: crossover junction endodeoxyribonuclease RuvC, partial [Fibrobacteres bacterium]|nr:crossover junction endodeoxyribonuclease RuvC [Fibrobacterota bacterium]